MKVESFKIADWEEEVTGLVIEENEEWVLVKNLPMEYIVDGYTLYKKEFIEERINTPHEALIEKVLGLKGIQTDKPSGFQFRDTLDTLKWVQEKYGLMEFQSDDEEELIFGRISKIVENVLIIDMIDMIGEVEQEYDYEFEIDEIRAITFETDYFNSIRLLWEENKKG